VSGQTIFKFLHETTSNEYQYYQWLLHNQTEENVVEPPLYLQSTRTKRRFTEDDADAIRQRIPTSPKRHRRISEKDDDEHQATPMRTDIETTTSLSTMNDFVADLSRRYGTTQQRSDDDKQNRQSQRVDTESRDSADRVSGGDSIAPLTSANKGHQLLKRLGWNEGSGLGRRETGIIEPIVASARTIRGGIGIGVDAPSRSLPDESDDVYAEYQRYRSKSYRIRRRH